MDFIEKVSVQNNHAFYSILFYFIINRKKQENIFLLLFLFHYLLQNISKNKLHEFFKNKSFSSIRRCAANKTKIYLK
jgi:hypothetical protein